MGPRVNHDHPSTSSSVKVKPASVLIGIVAVVAIVLVLINRVMLGTPVQVSLAFTSLSVPLWLVLLGLSIMLCAVFFALLLAGQVRLVAAHRKHAAELRAQRELVEQAEASRFTELRQYLEVELLSLRQANAASLERVHEEILAVNNSLAACIGEIDERLERQWPSAPEQQP
jgi:uncharacterized integral membrane protein